METVRNIEKYIGFFLPPCNTHKQIFKWLRLYLLEKIYNNPFGDLVPNIAANAMQMKLTILNEESSNKTREYTIYPETDNGVSLVVHRKSDHFRIVHLPESNIKCTRSYSRSELLSIRSRGICITRPTHKALLTLASCVWETTTPRCKPPKSSTNKVCFKYKIDGGKIW